MSQEAIVLLIVIVILVCIMAWRGDDGRPPLGG